MVEPSRLERIHRVAIAALITNVIVILGGALVRATNSGAGCGRSWPTCRGEIIPAKIEGALAIEFAHRLMSGAALIVVGVLFVMVRRRVPSSEVARNRQLRRAAGWSLIAIIGEALIGAGIVLFEWVEADSSIARTIAVPLHLVNTLLLLASLAMVVWLAQSDVGIDGDTITWRRVGWGLGLMVLVAATGAVTALADTLFPKSTIGFDDLGGREAFLTDLRVFHPALAVAASILVIRLAMGAFVDPEGRAHRLRRWLVVIVAIQLTVGVLNVVWFVPVPMQLVHLGLADAMWIVFVWFGAELLAREREPALTA